MSKTFIPKDGGAYEPLEENEKKEGQEEYGTFIKKGEQIGVEYTELGEVETEGTFIPTSKKEESKPLSEPFKEEENEETKEVKVKRVIKEETDKKEKDKSEDKTEEKKTLGTKANETKIINTTKLIRYSSGIATVTGLVAVAMGVRDMFLIGFTVLMGLIYIYSKVKKDKENKDGRFKYIKWLLITSFMLMSMGVTVDNLRYASMAFSIYSEEGGYTTVSRCAKDIGEKDRSCLHDGDKIIIYKMDGVSVKDRVDITSSIKSSVQD